jgi:hypothetical protein
MSNTITPEEHEEVQGLLAEITELEKHIPAAIKLVSTKGVAEWAELDRRISVKLQRVKEIYGIKGQSWKA